MLLHIKRARVERKLLRPEPGEPYNPFPGGQYGGHETAEGETGDEHRDLTDDERLSAVREELVDEGEENAREEAQDPHPEGPYG